jgi:hypothetical protein
LGNTVRGKTTVFGIFSRQIDRGDGDREMGRQRYLRDGDREIKESTEELKMHISAPIY